MLRVCLYLSVQCPVKDKREKFISVYIEDMLTGEIKDTIMNILFGMNIDLGSPEMGYVEEEEDDEEHYQENPIQDDDSSFQLDQNGMIGMTGVSLRMNPIHQKDVKSSDVFASNESPQKISQGQRQMMQYAEEKLRELESQRNLLMSEVDKLTVTGQDKDRIIESKDKEIAKIMQDNKKVLSLMYH